jgi:hypothetical protein
MSGERLKRPGCEHQHGDEPCCQPAFENEYRCSCGESWTDTWSCACDDECLKCGTVVSPHKSVEFDPCACDAL